MKLYKLTDEHGQTHNRTRWGEGVSHSGTGEGELCGPGWVHAYTHPLLAVLLNPIHANFADPQLWEAEGEVALTDHGLKVGCRSLTTIRRIPLPVVTTEQRVRFAILCAQRACTDPTWNAWADGWLSGEDRTEAAGAAARAVADAAAWEADRAADRAAAWAADAAAWAADAAEAAARAAAWAAARAAAWAAARAADLAAARAAEAANQAAEAANQAARAAEIDLIAIAEEACR